MQKKFLKKEKTLLVCYVKNDYFRVQKVIILVMKHTTSNYLIFFTFSLSGIFILSACKQPEIITFSGTIKDKTTGAPVEGAFIDLYIDNWSGDGTGSPYPTDALSDKEGKFTIYFEAGKTRAASVCCVTKEGYRPKHSFADSKIGEGQYDILLQPIDGALKVNFINKSGAIDAINFVAYNSRFVDKPYFDGDFFLSRFPLKLSLNETYSETIKMPAGVYTELFWGKSWTGPYRDNAPHRDSVFIKRNEETGYVITY